MSDFSLMCRDAIRDAGLSVYRISQISGMDRTTIQKMVSGDKFPSYSFFYRFLEQLRLNEEQRRRLLRMFEIEKDSYASYRNRRKILSIINEIGKEREQDSGFADKPPSGFLTENEEELYVRLENALDGCLAQQGSVVVRMNIPVKLKKIYDVFRCFINARREKNVFIEQLVLLNKDPACDLDPNVNLEYLSEVLSLACSLGENYKVFYRYIRGNERDHDYLLWPYYILLPGQAFFLSADCRSAWLCEKPELVGAILRRFVEQTRNAPSLFQVYEDYAEAVHVYLLNFRNLGLPAYTLENSPCLTFMYDEDVIRMLCGDLPDSFSDMVTEAKEYYEKAGDMVSVTKMFFSENGLELFLNEGVVMGGIAGFLGRIPQEARGLMLARFLENRKKQKGSVHMLDKRILPLWYPLMMEIFTSPHKVTFFLQNQEKKILYIEIEEASVCEAFCDFMEHLEDLRIACSEEETEERIRERLEREKE